MRFADEASSGLAGVPKYDMRLGPDTDGTALARYRQDVERHHQLDLPPEVAARFRSHSVTYQLPGAVLARMESVAQSLQRGPAEIVRGGDHLLVHVQVSGELEGIYGGQVRRLRPGDVAILDYSRAIASRSTDFVIFSLAVTRDMAPSMLLTPSAHGSVFTAASGAGRLLYRTIETLFATIDSLDVAEAQRAVDALLAVTAGMLEAQLAREAGSASGDAQLDRALAFIDRNLGRADLTPALVEANLTLSRSSLYRLFEPLGGVRSGILQRRLERAMKALLTGSAAKPPLRAIARDLGFATEPQLGRAFRTRFGVTPHQFYDMVRRRDHAALAAQAERAGFAHLMASISDAVEPDGGA
jgi:AraC-like DNA-binding protein